MPPVASGGKANAQEFYKHYYSEMIRRGTEGLRKLDDGRLPSGTMPVAATVAQTPHHPPTSATPPPTAATGTAVAAAAKTTSAEPAVAHTDGVDEDDRVGCRKVAATGPVHGTWPARKRARVGTSDVENSLGLKQPAALIDAWQPANMSAAFVQACSHDDRRSSPHCVCVYFSVHCRAPRWFATLVAVLQMPEWSPVGAQEVDQQDTATSAQGASHPATSLREGSHRIPSVQGKPRGLKDSKSHTAQGPNGLGDDAISSLLGSVGGSNEPSPGAEGRAADASPGTQDGAVEGHEDAQRNDTAGDAVEM